MGMTLGELFKFFADKPYTDETRRHLNTATIVIEDYNGHLAELKSISIVGLRTNDPGVILRTFDQSGSRAVPAALPNSPRPYLPGQGFRSATRER